MAELSNAVTVLIARMESHPEDFELYSGKNRPKFAGTAESLYGLVGLDAEKAGAFWFLPDVDKEALIAAWKKYHCTRFEKDVMETIFDDGSAEREAEELKRKIALRQAQQRAQMQNQMMNAAQQSPGQFTPISNAAQNNTGLLGSAANAFSGIFK